MGCICSKGRSSSSSSSDHVAQQQKEKEKEKDKNLVQVVAPSVRTEIILELHKGGSDKFVQSMHRKSSHISAAAAGSVKIIGEDNKTRIIERPKNGHQRRTTLDLGNNDNSCSSGKVTTMPNGAKGEQVAAGWPSWLTSVAAEAIHGLVPRSAESFEKLNKIGQGTYSSVYKARDLQSGNIVAMKKVRFVNMDPESVRFMAREISILRRLDHPNVMKLECLVTSRISGSLYLVFEYMEHDLAGLLASPAVKFTEPQIKCYMQQMLLGLEHCHTRGILHRDIKGSNLLIDAKGALKIGDFGLANSFQPDQVQPLTSRVVTLWYRAPELLLGATEYGVAIDMWSTGCILAELFVGKPIMPGRTEVEQMHKIFKLCGSPSEEYWRKTKLPHATSFKPQQPYKRRLPDAYKEIPSSAMVLIDVLLAIEPEKRGTATSALGSVFFTSEPLPCDPSTMPNYPPSKELDAKLRDEEARRRKADAKGKKVSQGTKVVITPEYSQGQHGQSSKSTSVKYNPQEDSGTGFRLEPPRATGRNGYQANSMIHPSVSGYSLNKKGKEDGGQTTGQTFSSRHGSKYGRQSTHAPRAAADFSNHHFKKEDRTTNNDAMGYVPKRIRILCSGPLMPPGRNMDDMLKEHERQISEAVRKARLDKARTKKNCYE